MKWHCLPIISAPMSFQMAFDNELFQLAKENPVRPPVIRFYYSSEPWITVGCSFRDARDSSRSMLIKKHPHLPVAKRVSGGGCVLHGDDIIFSLIIPLDQDVGRFTTTKTSYKEIHSVIALAFQRKGFDPCFYTGGEELPKGDDCFTFPVENDLEWGGQKIAGGAQKRSQGVLLHHESIRVPPGLSPQELISMIRDSFTAVLKVEFEDVELDADLYFETMYQSKEVHPSIAKALHGPSEVLI